MNINRMKVAPIDVPLTNRVHTARGLTSLPAGKAVPIFAAGLHREDAIASGRLRCSFELEETAQSPMNAIRVDVKAYVVPFLAFERFQGSMDILDKSYKGEAPMVGETVIPYIEQMVGPAYKSNDILTYLGLHYKVGTMINTAYIEAYNEIFNNRLKNRSPKLYDASKRTRLQANLAPAFWNHEMFRHVVPDFNQAAIDGEVPVQFGNQKLPVRGIGFGGESQTKLNVTSLRKVHDTGGLRPVGENWVHTGVVRAAPLESFGVMVKEDPAKAGFPDVWAELQANGVRISLSTIEMAKKTQAFARMREQYAGHTDEWLIDLLMDGIRVPEQALREPMLVAEASTIFGMSQRYATDAENLTEKVVSGATFVDLNIRMPALVTGGVLMVIAEITPEQLFERQRDAFLHMSDAEADRPMFLRDYLDPEKVEIVPNSYVDVDHATPNATFGYAPMGYKWNVTAPRVGGRFYRPQVNAGFDEDRQRIWAVETVNPSLGPDFYLCTNIHTKPFVVTNQDIAEVVTQGDLIIRGRTQFGPALNEVADSYTKVLDQVDMTKIAKV